MNKKVVHPPNMSITAKRKLLYLIEYFPGFEHFNGNGPGVLLERLVIGLQRHAPLHFDPYVYIGTKKDPTNLNVYPFTVIEDPGMQQLSETIARHNHKQAILHFANIEFARRYSEHYQHISRAWLGPIVQRVPLTSNVVDILAEHRADVSTFFAHVDMFISQSKQMTEELIALGFSTDKICQIENCIDVDQLFPPTANEKVQLRNELLPRHMRHDTVYLYAARLIDPVKKADELVRLWIENDLGRNGGTLILAGNYTDLPGSPQSEMNKLITAHGVEYFTGQHIIFTGLLNEIELKRYYKLADVYVTPSIREGFSNSTLEAMSFGLPVIGREGVSGHEELIADGENGFLFNDPDGLVTQLRELGHNALLRIALGKQARKHVKQHFSIEQMVLKYKEMYERLGAVTLI